MDTCIVCHTAYDPIWDEAGNLLLDPNTGICKKCQRKILDKEIEASEEILKLLEDEDCLKEKI